MPRNDDHAVRALTEDFLQRYPQEAAAALDALPAEQAVALLEEQPAARTVALIRRLRPDTAAEVFAALSNPRLADLLRLLEPARAAAILARLDSETRSRRLSALEPGLAKELTALMTYPPDTAGSLMDPRIITFRPDTPAREALNRLRAARHVRISDVFLVDEDGTLTGAVAVQDLAVANPATPLRELTRRPPVSVRHTAAQAELVEVLEQSRVPSLPVVDVQDRVVGVIRYEALMSAAQADATADLQTMVGVSRDERALSGFGFAVRRRLPWLQINLVTAFVAAAVVGLFEGTIAQFTALAVLLPVVAGQSGNTGAQALAVTMRGLALREIRPRHWFRVARKEVLAGAVNGLAVSIVTGAAVFLWSQSGGLALVITTAMVVSMVIAALAGASIPMLLTIAGQDPASASSIILTTVTDVVGFLSFLGLASLAAGML
jgi:magnesium transporter